MAPPGAERDAAPDDDTDPIISVDGFAVDMVPGLGPTPAAVREVGWLVGCICVLRPFDSF